MFFDDKSPEDVFTPRSPEVNQTMYINRPELESALLRAVRTGYHIVIHGDSGCGKSWLYKKIFPENRIYFKTLDLSASSTGDDVDLQILDLVTEYEEWCPTELEYKGNTSMAPGGMGFSGEKTRKMEKNEQSSLARLLHYMRHDAGRKQKAFLVLENMEHILDRPEVVSRVQNMLLALDDPKLGQFKVRVCLVGVPSEIKEILTAGNKFQTISNRVVEIPEVERISKTGANLLVTRGLEQQLELEIESKSFSLDLISYISDRIPQYLHDICLQTALLAEERSSSINPELIEDAFQNWVETNARQGYEFVLACLEKGGGMSEALGRVAYSVGCCDMRRFRADDIEKIARENFPNTINGRRIQCLQMLKKLAVGNDRLLKFDEDSMTFHLATPKLRPVLRAALKLDESEKVVIQRF